MSQHQKLMPYLVVRNGLQALKFYEEAFDAETELLLKTDDGKHVLHAALEIADNTFYLCDELGVAASAAASPETLGKACVVLHLFLRKPKHVDAIMQRAVDHGAHVVLPAHDASWGDRYGQIRDPFGHVWSFGAHIKSNTGHDTGGA